MRETLQLLGPELFTTQEFWGVTQEERGRDDPLIGPYAGESRNGFEDLGVYDTGLVVDVDGDADGIPFGGPGFASSPAMPVAGRDLRSTYLLQYRKNYIREECLPQPNGHRWIDNVSFWLFCKNEFSAVLPHVNSKAKTGAAGAIAMEYGGLVRTLRTEVEPLLTISSLAPPLLGLSVPRIICGS